MSMNDDNNDETKRKYLNAYSLTGIGIGSLIGAGFFLGSSLALNQAGPSVILAFLLGGLIMSQVLGAMTSISINRTSHRTFRYFSEEMLGPYIGSLLGWLVFASGILTICSEALASGVFLKYWFPHVSGSVFAFIILLAVIGINALGIRYLGLIESGMSLIKILVLVAFIILGLIFITNHGITTAPNPFSSNSDFFPKGIQGMLKSMLIVIFTYGGISAVAMASSEVQDPKKEIPKATILMTLGIVFLYLASITIITLLINWNSVSTSESPFVSALSKVGIKSASAIMNAVILISTISVMLASFYSSTRMLVSLSRKYKLFTVFTKETPSHFFRNAWVLVSVFTLLIIGASLLVSSSLFNYLISASSYFTFFNWSINLLTYLVWRKRCKDELRYRSHLISGSAGAYATLAAILLLFVFSLGVKDFRIGFYISLAIAVVISLFYLFGVSKKRIND
jgi:L-asparagine transporter-like permease